MVKPQTRKHLDKIELELTPKQWAIMYADEIRRHPCALDFLRAQAKGPYRESFISKPHRALLDQAEARHPGQKPEDIRARQEFGRALGSEYEALIGLIYDINREMEIMIEKGGLKLKGIASRLRAFLWQDTALMMVKLFKQLNVVESDGEKRLLTPEELVLISSAAGSNASLLSLARRWTDEATMLLEEMLACRAAVEAVQKEYFDGHVILDRSVEGALEKPIEQILEFVAHFNEYVSARESVLNQQEAQSMDETRPATATEQRTCTLRIDVDTIIRNQDDISVREIVSRWVTTAEDGATTSYLAETGNKDLLWERVRAIAERNLSVTKSGC